MIRIVLENIIDWLRLPFLKERQLCRSFYSILGFYPHRISLYRQAVMHRSLHVRASGGGRCNNERLEFLGDAVLGAVVGDIVYTAFEGKGEGFLTNARSKVVKRETLGRVAREMGLTELIRSDVTGRTHNSYMAGNAFEAVIGAVYLDRGYEHCVWFVKERVLGRHLDLMKLAREEQNFKSRLLEWCQKNKVEARFELVEELKEEESDSPVFISRIVIGETECARAKGYSKKESHQRASKEALRELRKDETLRNKVLGL